MTDLKLLKLHIRSGGRQIGELAQECGIDESRLFILLSGKDEFKASEMVSLTEALHLTGEQSGDIFFDR